MSPLLEAGDEVLVDFRAFRRRPPHPGDVAIVQHPYQVDLRMVKRIVAVTDDGRCQLQGDNPGESSDSRSFGLVTPDLLLGCVTSKFG